MSDKYEDAVKAIIDICDNESHEESIIRRGSAILRKVFPDQEATEIERAICIDILGERGRNVDEVNRLVNLLIAYREGVKAQNAHDVTAPRKEYIDDLGW